MSALDRFACSSRTSFPRSERCQQRDIGPAFLTLARRSVAEYRYRRPVWFVALASAPADAPAGGTAGVSSHADTIHHVHTGAACFADWNDQLVWLKDGYGWQSLC